MRYWPLLVYVLLNTAACAKDEPNNIYDHVACSSRMSPAEYDFGSGFHKAAVYDCIDMKGEACMYVWSLEDRAVSATSCEGPVVFDRQD